MLGAMIKKRQIQEPITMQLLGQMHWYVYRSMGNVTGVVQQLKTSTDATATVHVKKRILITRSTLETLEHSSTRDFIILINF